MRILLTGATGFNGKNLIGPISKAGHSLRCLVRKTSKKEDISWIKRFNAEIVESDLLDINSLQGIGDNIDLIIHTAGIVPEFNTKKNEIYDVNVNGTRNLINAARKSKVKKIIFYSTISVYGEANNADESCKLNNKGDYELSKIEAENIVSSSGINFTIFRLGMVFGPFNKRLSKIVSLITNKRLGIIAKGDNLIQPIFIGDFVRIVIKEAMSFNGNGIVNIAGERKITTAEFYNIISKRIFHKTYYPFIRIPYWSAKLYLISFGKLLSLIGIDPILTEQSFAFQTENRTYSIKKLRKLYNLRFTDLTHSVSEFAEFCYRNK